MIVTCKEDNDLVRNNILVLGTKYFPPSICGWVSLDMMGTLSNSSAGCSAAVI